MTKRKRRLYRTLRFYNQDCFARLVLKDPKSFRYMLDGGFKNAKVNTILYNDKEDWLERKKRFKESLGKSEKLFYRVDIAKPKRRRRRLSVYGKRLMLRFKLRKFASQMTVRQFRSYVKKASKGNFLFIKFLRLLESRIDFIGFRMNLFDTSSQGRQYINHGRLLLNGKVAKFPNQQVGFFDTISVLDKQFFWEKILYMFGCRTIYFSIPRYLEINYRILTAVFIFPPFFRNVFYPSKFTNSTMLAAAGKRFNSFSR